MQDYINQLLYVADVVVGSQHGMNFGAGGALMVAHLVSPTI